MSSQSVACYHKVLLGITSVVWYNFITTLDCLQCGQKLSHRASVTGLGSYGVTHYHKVLHGITKCCIVLDGITWCCLYQISDVTCLYRRAASTSQSLLSRPYLGGSILSNHLNGDQCDQQNIFTSLAYQDF